MDQSVKSRSSRKLGLPEDTPIALIKPDCCDTEIVSLGDIKTMVGDDLYGAYSELDSYGGPIDELEQLSQNAYVDTHWYRGAYSRMPFTTFVPFMQRLQEDLDSIKEAGAQNPEVVPEMLLDSLYRGPAPELKGKKSEQIFNTLARHYCQPVSEIATRFQRENTTTHATRAALNAQWLAAEQLPDQISTDSEQVRELLGMAAFYRATMKSNNPDGGWQDQAAKYFLRDLSQSDYPEDLVKAVHDAMTGKTGEEAEQFSQVLENSDAITDLKGKSIDFRQTKAVSATKVQWGNMTFPIKIWNDQEKSERIINAANSAVDLAYVTGATPGNDSREEGHYRERMGLTVKGVIHDMDMAISRKVDLAEHSYTAMVEMQKDNLRRKLATEAGIHGSDKAVHNEYTLKQIDLPELSVLELMQADTSAMTSLVNHLGSREIEFIPRIGSLTQEALASTAVQTKLLTMGYKVVESERYFIDFDNTPLKVTLLQAVPTGASGSSGE